METKQLAKILIYVLKKKLNADINNVVNGEALKGN